MFWPFLNNNICKGPQHIRLFDSIIGAKYHFAKPLPQTGNSYWVLNPEEMADEGKLKGGKFKKLVTNRLSNLLISITRDELSERSRKGKIIERDAESRSK